MALMDPRDPEVRPTIDATRHQIVMWLWKLHEDIPVLGKRLELLRTFSQLVFAILPDPAATPTCHLPAVCHTLTWLLLPRGPALSLQLDEWTATLSLLVTKSHAVLSNLVLWLCAHCRSWYGPQDPPWGPVGNAAADGLPKRWRGGFKPPALETVLDALRCRFIQAPGSALGWLQQALTFACAVTYDLEHAPQGGFKAVGHLWELLTRCLLCSSSSLRCRRTSADGLLRDVFVSPPRR